MGGRGMNSGRGGGRINTNHVHLGSREFNQYLDGLSNIQVNDFALDPPDTINVGGLEMSLIHQGRTVNGGNYTYTANYQSTMQATNGEWPTVQISVNEKTRKRRGGGLIREYKLDRSTLGSRIL